MSNPLSFKIYGMDCAEEVAILKREVGPAIGGEDRLAFDILNARMIVKVDPGVVTADEVIKIVARTGMRGEVWVDDVCDQDDGFWVQHSRTVMTTISGLMACVGFILHVESRGVGDALGFEGSRFSHDAPTDAVVFYLLAIFSGISYVLPKAWLAIRRLHPDMNLLMTIAVAGAIGIGEWFEASMVAFLFALSLTLESWSVGRARRAVATLMDLSPTTARMILPGGGEQRLTPEQVPVDARVRVGPGERIPVDGRVAQGSSEVNQAPITGESMPVLRQIGDSVFAGTINGDGSLEVLCTRPATDTRLAGIIRLVGEAQSKRAPSEQWVERFARVYTPAIMASAVLIFLIPPLFLGADWNEWIYRALVLLVIGCPCALVISTPVSIVAALAASARHGILVKGGVYMEAPAHLAAVAFDKTGTLSQGRPEVVEIIPMKDHTEEDLLARAAAMEAHSDHPIARAVFDCAQERLIRLRSADEFQMLPGKGVTASFDGEQYWIGSHRYLEERKQETEEVHQILEERANLGQTVMVVGNDDHVCGIIAIADAIRPETPGAIQELRRNGVRHLIMLTGDNEGTAQAFAKQAEIDEVCAELLPENKVAVVESLVSEYGTVAMVGDGVNDAPAMSRATLGIAMGAAGSDTAIETADIALMADDLSKLPWLMRHSRKTLTVIRQNIVIALLIKALFLVLTFLGYASLWAAIGADMGASLVVIFNSLLLLNGGDE